ncbi:MAG: glycine zipper 2TM domain-containing protein [Rhodocyclaceae bacterium]|nr:MAG: glycine zipper 2TM domain-containing protein [Rhodocyclaceae bacterium]
MKTPLIVAVLPFLVATHAFAANDAARKEAAARYAEDKKLCAEESTSSVRMQCLRDAKAEYNKALKSAATKTSSSGACPDCGKVVAVRVEEKAGEGSALGVIAGGVAGAVLGNQVGQGTGRDIATIAGAAGGAYAGHKIEEKVKSSKVWKVSVRFDSGDEKTYSFEKDPGFAAGDLVKAGSGSIVRR